MNEHVFGVLRPRSIARSASRLVTLVVATSLVALGLTATTLAPAGAVQAQSLTATSAMSAAAAEDFETTVKRLINHRRVNHGLQRLRFVDCADASAETWASYLAANDAFYHQSMTNVLDRCDAQYAGETLGRGSMTPRQLVQMWMESPGHRAVLLSSKSRRIGVGASPDIFGRWVVAANFVRL